VQNNSSERENEILFDEEHGCFDKRELLM